VPSYRGIPGAKVWRYIGTACLEDPAELDIIQQICTAPPNTAILATTLCRLTRSFNGLQLLRRSTVTCGVELLVQLVPSHVLDAALPAGVTRPNPADPADYVAACLGAAAADDLPSHIRDAANAVISHSHAATQHAAVTAMVFCPVSVPYCNELVYDALVRHQGETAAFALSRVYSFSGASYQGTPTAVAAATAGLDALHVTITSPGVARGLTVTKQQQIVEAVTSTLQQVLRCSTEASNGLGGAAARRGRHWTCTRSCGCEPGRPHPGCYCNCSTCTKARRGLCPCAAAQAADMLDTLGCACPEGCCCGCACCSCLNQSAADASTAAPTSAVATAVRVTCKGPGCQAFGEKCAHFCSALCYKEYCSDTKQVPRMCMNCGTEVSVPGGAYGLRCMRCHWDYIIAYRADRRQARVRRDLQETAADAAEQAAAAASMRGDPEQDVKAAATTAVAALLQEQQQQQQQQQQLPPARRKAARVDWAPENLMGLLELREKCWSPETLGMPKWRGIEGSVCAGASNDSLSKMWRRLVQQAATGEGPQTIHFVFGAHKRHGVVMPAEFWHRVRVQDEVETAATAPNVPMAG
jgi:hypothetical protein